MRFDCAQSRRWVFARCQCRDGRGCRSPSGCARAILRGIWHSQCLCFAGGDGRKGGSRYCQCLYMASSPSGLYDWRGEWRCAGYYLRKTDGDWPWRGRSHAGCVQKKWGKAGGQSSAAFYSRLGKSAVVDVREGYWRCRNGAWTGRAGFDQLGDAYHRWHSLCAG